MSMRCVFLMELTVLCFDSLSENSTLPKCKMADNMLYIAPTSCKMKIETTSITQFLLKVYIYIYLLHHIPTFPHDIPCHEYTN